MGYSDDTAEFMFWGHPTMSEITPPPNPYAKPHVCNYASRYRMTLCQRVVSDGHRYCWQHRP